ncbi:sortase [Candidatus Peribacteria bacterium]|nr:sortase [Candidatus Peribacteria bacterium]
MKKAHYTQSGDIILDGDDIVPEYPREVIPTSKISGRSEWTTVIEEALPLKDKTPVISAKPERISSMQKLSEGAKNVIVRGSRESTSQLHATAEEVMREVQQMRQSWASLPTRIRGGLNRFWKSANTPIHLPRMMKAGKKPPTKLRLFLVDTIRFGGTFAGIFLVLFVAINYQSFLQIAKAELALSDDLKTQQELQQFVTGINSSAATSYEDDNDAAGMDLLASLPYVGPFEDRLIIPKLGENVPIVRPSMEALMKEDWRKFEEDIQTALQDGVVHYPGSARPGQAGNFFVTGHSSYYPWDDGKYKNVFARLKDLIPGDTYSVYYGGDRHTYRITGKKEVRPSDVSVLDQPTNKRIATLMTCTPLGTTLRRLIITAEEIDPATGEALMVGERGAEEQIIPTARLESLPI